MTEEQRIKNRDNAKYMRTPEAREKARTSMLSLHRHCSYETKLRISLKARGRKHTEESKRKMSESKKNVTLSLENHKRWVSDTQRKLQQEGFRTILIAKPLPDIIALKDGKIYAVEVDDGFSFGDTLKYNVPHGYDDVIWVCITKERGK